MWGSALTGGFVTAPTSSDVECGGSSSGGVGTPPAPRECVYYHREEMGGRGSSEPAVFNGPRGVGR